MELVHGRGGWVSVHDVGLPGPLYLRFTIRGEVGELFLDAQGAAITPGDLRTLPLGRIAAAALSRPDLLDAAPAGNPLPDVAAELHKVAPRPVRYRSKVDTTARLSAPTAGLTDAFLRDVARAYTAAVARGVSPNKALQEQAHAPIRTVERWVYLARKAGHLPPARREARS